MNKNDNASDFSDEQPECLTPARDFPFNTRYLATAINFEPDVTPHLLPQATLMLVGVYSENFCSLMDVKHGAEKGMMMILQIARITPSKNVASNARGTNGSDKRQTSRAVNYTCIFTLIDPNAPEGDNTCFILFG